MCTSADGGVVTADVGTVSMAGTGGLLMINARLKNVCPGKRILLGVWVTRETPDGCQMCGFKSYELQPNTGTVVRDIVVKGLRFLLPPPEPESCSCGDSQCYQVYAAALTVVLKKGSLRGVIKGVATFWLFALSHMALTLLSFVKKERTWRPIAHTNTARIEDLTA